MELLHQSIKLLVFTSIDTLSSEFFLRFAINLIAMLVLLRFIYYPTYRNKDYIFTLALFNAVIFVIAFLLNKIEITLGFALGLFAVFTMLRYRTQTINTKNMTFLVIAIGLALLHSVAPVSPPELIILNFLILGLTYFINSDWFIRTEFRKSILYEKIDMIRPDKREELMNDLKDRTGLNIHRFEIGRIDFMRDVARIRVYYYQDGGPEEDPEEDEDQNAMN